MVKSSDPHEGQASLYGVTSVFGARFLPIRAIPQSLQTILYGTIGGDYVFLMGSALMTPSLNTAYTGKNRSYYAGDVARRLLSIADEYVNIRMVYADREFHATDVISALEERDLNYVIPAVKTDRIGPICDRFGQLKRGYDEENDTPLYVKNEFRFTGE